MVETLDHTRITAQEQEALFQAIVQKIPSIRDAEHLREIVTLALALMLRRPVDRGLKEKLGQCVHDIFAAAPEAAAEDPRAGLRRAALDCVEVLQAAREHRLPRKIVFPEQTRGKPVGKALHAVHRHVASGETYVTNTMRGVMAGVALMALLGGLALWHGSGPRGGSGFSEANRFAAQIIAAAEGSGETTHLFGGTIRVQAADGHTVVVVEQVPPRICAASGWTLVHKGILTVNGVTPSRVSSAIITELCNSQDGDATLMWMARPASTP